MRTRFCTVVGSALCVLASSVAKGNLLVNGGLETALSPTMPDNLVYASPTLNPTALTGWTITQGSIDIVPSSYFASSQGNFSVDLVGTPGIGGISQTVATTPGTNYTLTFDFSVNPDTWIFDETLTIKRLQVSALAADGVTVLASDIFSDGDGTRTRSSMQYMSDAFLFTATGPSTTLKLEALAPLNLGPLLASQIYTGPVIDNLDLEVGGGAPSPEPGTLGALGLGGLLLLRRRRG